MSLPVTSRSFNQLKRKVEVLLVEIAQKEQDRDDMEKKLQLFKHQQYTITHGDERGVRKGVQIESAKDDLGEIVAKKNAAKKQKFALNRELQEMRVALKTFVSQRNTISKALSRMEIEQLPPPKKRQRQQRKRKSQPATSTTTKVVSKAKEPWQQMSYKFLMKRLSQHYSKQTLNEAIPAKIEEIRAIWPMVISVNKQIEKLNATIQQDELEIRTLETISYPSADYWENCFQRKKDMMNDPVMWKNAMELALAPRLTQQLYEKHQQSWARFIIPILMEMMSHVKDEQGRKRELIQMLQTLRGNPLIWMLLCGGSIKDFMAKYFENPLRYSDPKLFIQEELRIKRSEILLVKERLAKLKELQKPGEICPGCSKAELRYQGAMGYVGVGKGTIAHRYECGSCGKIITRNAG